MPITSIPYPTFSQVYQYAGSNQTCTVPSGVSTITLHMWGAGGGGGGGGPGGAGAYLTGQLAIPSGQSQFSIIVGGGGISYLGSDAGIQPKTFGGGGGRGGTTNGGASSGGGRSAIQYTLSVTISSASGASSIVTYTTSGAHRLSVGQPVIITGLTPAGYNGTFSVATVPLPTTFTVANATTGTSSGFGTIVTELVTVGGGGGAGGNFQSAAGQSAGNATFSGTAGSGSGSHPGGAAFGGTQTAGGATGSFNDGGVAGSLLTGGNAIQTNGYGGGGGGAGYYGGGGGCTAGNGGGGSSYGSNVIGLSGANTPNGSFAAPGTGVSGYVAGVAAGGSNYNVNGGNGLVLISYNTGSPSGIIQRAFKKIEYGLASSFTVLSNDNVTYTIPAGVTRVRLFLWGGGAAGWGYGAAGGGGSGAHVQGDLSVAGISTLTIYNDRGKGPGGAMSGGGYSAVYTAANGYLMIAGAGGGSSGGRGGGGGYLHGFQGDGGIQSREKNGNASGGGSQTQGGLGGNGGGSYLQGGAGDSSGYPAGGGGGYYGGGGSAQPYGAGGGSSYVNTAYITNYSGADGSNGSLSGNVLPGGSSSPYYPTGIGVGKGNAPSYDPSTTSSCVVIVPYAPPPTGIIVRGSTKVAYPVFSQIFQAAGSNQIYTVPSGVSTITLHMWGGGGGGGNGGKGGAGAYLTGQLAIPSGQTQLSILVGGAGLFSNASTTFGSGGSGSTVSNSGSSGGGRSAIQYTVTATISSASGASSVVTYTTNIAHGLVVGQPVIITGLTPAGYNGTFPVTVVSTPTSFRVANGTTGASSGTGTIVAELVNVGGGGGGGGSFQTIYHYAGNATFSGSANNAVGAVAGGTGGTQTAGGFTNSYGGNPAGTNGSFLTGGPGFIGNGFGGGGGGGGGYYGGGGGGGAGNGGGGSSYGSNVIGLSGANTPNGSFAAPGTGVSGYVSGVAVGASNQTTNGGPGLVIIRYSSGSPAGIVQ